MSNKIRIQKHLSPEELPGFFRQLAEAFEQGGQGELECVDEFRKIKIGLKHEFGQVSIRASIKTRGVCEPATENLVADGSELPQLDYKVLKKRMKRSFLVITTFVEQGKLPPREAMVSFLADSGLMVGYEGRGEECYDEYSESCSALDKAYAVGDVEEMARVVGSIVLLKKRCHSRHA